MLIPNEKINEIIAKADIVSVISSHIKVQKKGRNYWAVCPFHDDNNPSMSISPDKKIYKCFSCGASGNVVEFVKNYQHLDFLTALKNIADEVGVDLSELNQHQPPAKYSPTMETIFKINEEAMNFYMVLLASQSGQVAKDYLLNRNISPSEILKWEIGYSSKAIKLHETLIAKGYTLNQLNDAGLVTIRDGQVYDYFFDRVIFPIKNEDEKVIGFSGRSLENIQPKYVNTRETLVFKKSNLVFNLHQALKSANLKKSLLVLEGFMDVISLTRVGIDNAIAIMGTNLSDYHLKLFQKSNVEIKIFLDGDWPGVNATLKASKKLIQQKIKTTVVDNLTSQDPDELISDHQEAKVELMIKNSLHPIIYAAEKLPQFLDLNQPDDLKKYLNQVFELIVLNNDLVIQEKILKKLTGITQLSYETLFKSFTEYQKTQSVIKLQTQERISPPAVNNSSVKTNWVKKNPSKKVPLKNYEFSQRQILHSLITSQQNLTQIEKNLTYIPNSDLYVVLKALTESYHQGTYHENNWTELMKILELSSFDYQDPKWRITPDDLLVTESQNQNLDDAFLVLQEYRLLRQEKKYSKQIQEAASPELKKKLLEAKEKNHSAIINLQKKRGKK